MPSPGEPEAPRRPSVFLSYPSEDREAARSLRDALTDGGLEVWYDENELTGGDAWDQKIRRQIRECDYFMPLISAQSEARREGYFRREWRLAVERTLDMADDHLFLLPVVIDATEQGGARVPEKFLTVQWLRIPAGRPTPALSALCARLLAGEAAIPTPAPRRVPPPLPAALPPSLAKPAASQVPAFPTQEPGQPVKFWVHVIMWAGKSTWITFQRLPKALRIVVYIYLSFLVVSDSCSSHSETSSAEALEKAEKLKAIAARYGDGGTKGDVARLGTDIAREFAHSLKDKPAAKSLYWAVPFAASAAAPAAQKLANTAFVMLYGRLSISRTGEVGLAPDHLGPDDLPMALAAARTAHARYLVLGGVQASEPSPTLTIEIANARDGTIVWTKKYPVGSSDPDTVAAEVEKNLPDADDDE